MLLELKTIDGARLVIPEQLIHAVSGGAGGGIWPVLYLASQQIRIHEESVPIVVQSLQKQDLQFEKDMEESPQYVPEISWEDKFRTTIRVLWLEVFPMIAPYLGRAAVPTPPERPPS